MIGTTFGGDGQSNFALPDLRGRTPICTGQGVGLTNRVRGEVTGTPTTTIALSQLVPHTHVLDPTNTRRPGEPRLLLLGKNALDPGKIDLTWGVGCPSGATGFAVYEGTLAPSRRRDPRRRLRHHRPVAGGADALRRQLLLPGLGRGRRRRRGGESRTRLDRPRDRAPSGALPSRDRPRRVRPELRYPGAL